MSSNEIIALLVSVLVIGMILIPIYGIRLGSRREIVIFRSTAAFHFSAFSVYGPPLIGVCAFYAISFFADTPLIADTKKILINMVVPAMWAALIGMCIVGTYRENKYLLHFGVALITKYALVLGAIFCIFGLFVPRSNKTTIRQHVGSKFVWLAGLAIIFKVIRAVTLNKTEESEWLKEQASKTIRLARSHKVKLPSYFNNRKSS